MMVGKPLFSLISRRISFVVTYVLTTRIYVVVGDSMLPSFKPGDRLLGNRNYKHDGSIPRSIAVVVKRSQDSNKQYLKRIVGLPGEDIRVADGMLLINGHRKSEPYLGGLPGSPGHLQGFWQLTRNEYFILGDNRSHSKDSRDFGPVHSKDIISKVWFRCWPISRVGITS